MRAEVARTTLNVIFIGLLIIGSLWILRPFLGALIWATMVVVATWPALIWLQKVLRGWRWLAAALMTTTLLLTFVVPLSLAIVTIVGSPRRLGQRAGGLAHAAAA